MRLYNDVGCSANIDYCCADMVLRSNYYYFIQVYIRSSIWCHSTADLIC